MLSQLLLTMVHIFLYVGSWLVNLPTMASLCDCRLQRVMIFISFVPVWLFHFFSVSFQAKSMYSSPTISCVNRVKRWSVICLKHAFMPCWIAALYVARGFCTSVHLFIYCQYVCFTALYIYLFAGGPHVQTMYYLSQFTEVRQWQNVFRRRRFVWLC